MNVRSAEEDSDVSAERTRLIADQSSQNDLVRVIGLRKECLSLPLPSLLSIFSSVVPCTSRNQSGREELDAWYPSQ
jgi:hypothetical protein